MHDGECSSCSCKSSILPQQLKNTEYKTENLISRIKLNLFPRILSRMGIKETRGRVSLHDVFQTNLIQLNLSYLYPISPISPIYNDCITLLY